LLKDQLPDNPYLYLANQLGAFIDQSYLWKENDMTVLSEYDTDGGITLGDGGGMTAAFIISACWLRGG